jgi:ribonuclease VapC
LKQLLVDASALVAVIAGEPSAKAFRKALVQTSGATVTPFTLMETGLAVMRIFAVRPDEAHRIVMDALSSLGIAVVPLTESMILLALQAFARYGKGKGHPARLNMGDCLSYGAARALGQPLLFKGDDLGLTDIADARTR